MLLTDLLLLLTVISLLSWLLYEEKIIFWRKEPVLCKVRLLRERKTDGIVIIVLLILLLFSNITSGGLETTNLLISMLIVICVYMFLIRRSYLFLKREVAYLSPFWIGYKDVKNINLSSDGVLLVDLGKKRLIIKPENVEDLQAIYLVMIGSSPSEENELLFKHSMPDEKH